MGKENNMIKPRTKTKEKTIINKTKEILSKVIIDAYDEQVQGEKLLWEHII